MDFATSLNPRQLEAVQHRSGPLLILAGAGTGKTRVLVHRIAHLVKEQNLPPARILAVTFTNKAAGEMKQRLETLIGPKARELWVGTFHAVCVKMLRRHPLEAGLSPRFVIYDEADQKAVLKQALKDLNLDEKKLPAGALAHKISRLKDRLISFEAFVKTAGNPFEKTLAKIYAAYEKVLTANQALDFGDLIFRCVTLLEQNPALLQGYQKMWAQILIDEYQDTNHAQYRWTQLLAAGHRNVCVVGDPDQSIYRWRGADLNNILMFEKDYPDAKVIRLEQNYRSVQNILGAAGGVIAHNVLRKEKKLWSEQPPGEKIVMAALNSDREEARFVVEALQQGHTNQKIPYAAMAVFYRTNAQSRALEEALQMSGIPYRIFGGIRFYERAEVKDALAYLRIFHSPYDGVSWRRIINSPARGIGKTTIERIDHLAQTNVLSFWEAAQRVEGHAKLKSFLDWYESLRTKMELFTPVELLQQILETSGYLAALTVQSTLEAQERLANLNELVAGLAEFETLEEFLEHVALITDLDQNSDDGFLSLMTLHLAKGLEFRAVAIVGLEEGLLPHARSQDELEELEEERRLFYVGMTRAKEYLLISRAWRRYLNGQEQYSLPSRFLEEIPADLIEAVEGARREPEEDWDQRIPEERSDLAYRVGTKVRHAAFGIGTVAAAERTSLGEKVTVRFANGAIKKLIAGYARLEKL